MMNILIREKIVFYLSMTNEQYIDLCGFSVALFEYLDPNTLEDFMFNYHYMTGGDAHRHIENFGVLSIFDQRLMLRENGVTIELDSEEMWRLEQVSSEFHEAKQFNYTVDQVKELFNNIEPEKYLTDDAPEHTLSFIYEVFFKQTKGQDIDYMRATDLINRAYVLKDVYNCFEQKNKEDQKMKAMCKELDDLFESN